MFEGIFGKIKDGMCRLTMDGKIAVKTSTGYKAYNMKTGNFVNCDQFAFDIGSDYFFVIPTNHVKSGDIILKGGKPQCVLEADKKTIKAVNYEDATIDTILPERHVFMGETYFYGKIVSVFSGLFSGKKKGNSDLIKMMMLSSMMGGNSNFGKIGGDNTNPILLMALMGNSGVEDMFDGIFDDGEEENAEEEA